MLVTDQVAIAPCTDCVQPGRPTFDGDACGRLDHLNRLAPHVRKNSAQNLVTANNLAERLLECRDVQIAFQSHPERDVKDSAKGAEYDSQGQARSASPLVTHNKTCEP